MDDRSADEQALRPSDVAELAAALRDQLAAIEAGDLDASTAVRERLIGALTALRVVLGDDPDHVLSILTKP